jgi:MFS superfamily sulfate permease-like transporter
VLALLVQDPHNPKCLVVDAVACFTHQDISVMSMVGELHKELKRRGIHMVMAGRHGQMSQWFKQAGIGSARMASSSAPTCIRPCA